ncbi:MAG: DNA cytosine methyltransferase [Alphaproteobacteria bacterium]
MKAIDLFAGAGGFSTGARMAGVQVVWAANHWPEAVEIHARNHPGTSHACQDLHQADFTRLPEHDLLLASPSCQGHARARGKERAHHDAARATAWAVVAAAEACRSSRLLIENVPEFTRWTLFPSWCDALERLGYQLRHDVLDAAAAGVPQSRRRVFVSARLGKTPPPIELTGQPRPIAPHLGWDKGNWSPIEKPRRAEATLNRVAAGRKAHGDRFLISYYGQSKGGRCISRPIGTITTRDRWALIDGPRMRMLSVNEARAAMGFPASYRLPENKRLAMHMLGNAVPPPLAAAVIRESLS